MKYIIPIIVGSIIGYATNWLAIKMLFRPHYEKRFMGVKIPFTPGLIPKEKERISKNIGETVGEYLLSPETIAESLSNQKTNPKIKSWIEGKIEGLKDSGKSIKDLLVDGFGEEYNNIIQKFESTISNLLICQIRSEEIKNMIIDFIKSKLYDDEIYEYIRVNLETFLEKSLRSTELELLMASKLKEEFHNISKDERLVKEVLPERLQLEIDKYLNGNIEGIGNGIKDIINSPDIQSKLKSSISNMVDQNVSRIITSFISLESISEKIYSAISKYINDESSNREILLIVKSLRDKIMENKVSQLTTEILDIIDPKDISKYLLDYISQKDNQKGIIDIIDEKIKEINREKLMMNLSKELDIILDSDKLEEGISSLVSNGINELIDRPIDKILDKFEDTSSQIARFTKIFCDKFIKDELPEIIRLFNVSKIVEDEINKFDVEFTEKLILDIAQKELRAITRLGALLGGIMGLLSPILQML